MRRVQVFTWRMLGAFLLSGAVFPQLASARQTNYFMIGRVLGESVIGDGWNLVEMTDSINGLYSGNMCGITKSFPDRTTLAIFQSVQAKTAFVSFSNKDWQSLNNRHHEQTAMTVSLKPIGLSLNFQADIIGDGNPELSADVPAKVLPLVLENIADASRLEVSVANKSVFAGEVQAQKPIAALLACVAKIETAVAKQRANDPFSR